MSFSNGITSPVNGPSDPFTSTPFSTAPTVHPPGAPVRTVSSSGPFASSTQSPPSHSPANAAAAAERGGVLRRTTVNGSLPTLNTFGASSLLTPLSPIGQQRRQAAESNSLASLDFSVLQQKKEEYAMLQLNREREMEQTKQKLEQLENDIHRLSVAGASSEPTTPPDLRDGLGSETLPPFGSRHGNNRFSLASLGSYQTAGNPRPTRSFHRSTMSGSHHTINYLGLGKDVTAQSSTLNSQANSDDEEGDAFEMPPTSRRSNVRNSMPVTGIDFMGVSGNSTNTLGMNTLNGINSLFANEDDYHFLPQTLSKHRHTASTDNSILHVDITNEDFPVLVRRTTDSSSSMLGGTNLATAGSSASVGPGRMSSFRRHRQGQQSLPMNTLPRGDHEFGFSHARAPSLLDLPSRDGSNRSSLDLSQVSVIGSNRSSLLNPPSLRATHSTNDVPTLGNQSLAALSHAEQHLQNHNVSSGRYPHRRNLSSSRLISEPAGSSLSALPSTSTNGALPSLQTAGVPNSTLYGSPTNLLPTSIGLPGGLIGAQANMYPGIYNVQPGNLGMQTSAMSFGAPGPLAYGVPMPYINPVSGYQGSRLRDSQQAVIAQRRAHNEGERLLLQYERLQRMEAMHLQKQNSENAFPARCSDCSRTMHLTPSPDSERMAENNYYANMELSSLVGKIFETSQDQHGARFLQKKIDEDRDANLAVVFNEVKEHIVELMKDPFGNYLCQRILECGTVEQRTILLHNCSGSMVDIATNQHGTRALQRLIEYVQGPEQIQVIVDSLRADVVPLIEDLNGNHVIQKCLNHLRPDDAQFIFEAVGENAFKVGIHRHGCCVLQRCIDHADGPQKDKLISQVVASAYALSQDQYGNYVIQYILDHATQSIIIPLGKTFEHQVVALSKQKFSSNVIEKSIRIFGQLDVPTQRRLLEELLISDDIMESLVRDGFANYVVQTALEHSPQDIGDRLWEIMARILSRIRGTPAGRRIAQKYNQRNNSRSAPGSGTATPQDTTTPNPASAAFVMPPQQLSMGNPMATTYFGTNGGMPGLPNGQAMLGNGVSMTNGFGPGLNGLQPNLGANSFAVTSPWAPSWQQAPRQGGNNSGASNGHAAGGRQQQQQQHGGNNARGSHANNGYAATYVHGGGSGGPQSNGGRSQNGGGYHRGGGQRGHRNSHNGHHHQDPSFF